MNEELSMIDYPPVIATLTYRGQQLDFYSDDAGQQMYTIFNGKEIGFGAYNLSYLTDAKYMIDKFLDEIPTNWDIRSKYFGAKLTWYKNWKTSMWNIKLSYRNLGVITRWEFSDEQYRIVDDIPPKLSDKLYTKLIGEAEVKLSLRLINLK